MAQITIGQYYPENSPVHRLDPRVKLFGTFIFVVSLFISDNLAGYALVTAVLAVIVIISRVPFKKLLKGIRGILFILLFSAFFNIFFTNEGQVLLNIGKLSVTTGGLERAAFIAVRLVYLVIGASMMTLTTSPGDLSDALEKSFGFLKKIKFPVHEIAMMMSLALRFIPTLMEETDKIMQAQEARGADFKHGNIFQRVKNFLPLLIPLFVSSLNRAFDLALAMESRCYNGGGGRTKFKPLRYKKNDRLAYCLFAVYLTLIVSFNILFSKIPELSILRF